MKAITLIFCLVVSMSTFANFVGLEVICTNNDVRIEVAFPASGAPFFIVDRDWESRQGYGECEQNFDKVTCSIYTDSYSAAIVIPKNSYKLSEVPGEVTYISKKPSKYIERENAICTVSKILRGKSAAALRR